MQETYWYRRLDGRMEQIGESSYHAMKAWGYTGVRLGSEGVAQGKPPERDTLSEDSRRVQAKRRAQRAIAA